MSDLTDTELEAALERFVRNQLHIEELMQEQDMIKSFFKNSQSFPPGTSTLVGKFYIKVSTNTRIDQKLAEEHLSYRERQAVSKSVVDSAKARHMLKEDTLKKITKVYENRIEIGLN